MDLTDLKVFLAIVEEGSLTRAAQKLDYVQSNVTTRVRKLEMELGAQLFHRNPKGVKPTERGLVFRNYAVDILHMVEEAIMAVKEPDYPCGPLVIGVVETIASSQPFIRALSDFQKTYPEVALSLITGTSPQNYEKVLNHQLDGAFCTGEFDLSSLHTAHEIREEVFLLTAADGTDTLASPDVANAAWVVFPKGCPFRAAIEDWLGSEGASPANIIEISTMETMLNCVRAGIGYALLTESAVTVADDRVRVHPVPERYRFATTRLVSRNERFHNKAFAAFANCIRAAVI
ncbi:LysR family transcriptional regulator [Paenibacillus nasutitermitis]|uniref:HTH-type transcriptional regulator CzcR n=1 Tax=Paenibacillus nasutitermitis TaxID=1652958 RepID=A0A917E070_9BACL|nr:LysR family transcriptional regulator [Paenibacillus nasutitermitis]GGD84159.1 HTH-type transcriptional regulator CzcR [Paenibacillus nasutitermitis]